MKKGLVFDHGHALKRFEAMIDQGLVSPEMADAVKLGVEKSRSFLASSRKDEPARVDIARLKHVVLRHSGRGFFEPDWYLNDCYPAIAAEALAQLGWFRRPLQEEVMVVSGKRNSCWENAKEIATRLGVLECHGFLLSEGWWQTHAFAVSRDGIIYDTVSGDAYFGVAGEAG